jgi:hypothetical protein
MRLEEEGEVGIQGCLTPKPDNSFLKSILGQYTYPFFGLQDSHVRKEFVFLYRVMAWIHIDSNYMWNYSTWVLRLLRTGTV